MILYAEIPPMPPKIEKNIKYDKKYYDKLIKRYDKTSKRNNLDTFTAIVIIISWICFLIIYLYRRLP